MEISEKLDIFYRATIEAANGQSEAIQEEYRTAYRELLSKYEQKKQEGWQNRSRIEEEKIRKEVNRAVSAQIMEMKKEYHAKQEQRRDEVFALVEEKLAAYRRTEAYREFLKGKILGAKEFAAGSELTVYLDPADQPLRDGLERETGCSLTMSDENFGGGIRAVLHAKNILMDESFAGRLAEEREKVRQMQ